MGVDKVEELRQNIRINTDNIKKDQDQSTASVRDDVTRYTSSSENSSDDSDSKNHSTSHTDADALQEFGASTELILQLKKVLKLIAPHQNNLPPINITINNKNTKINHIIQKSNEESKVNRETDVKIQKLDDRVKLCEEVINGKFPGAINAANYKTFYKWLQS